MTHPPVEPTLTEFPPAEMALLRAIVDHDAWEFARKFLKTGNIFTSVRGV